MEDNKFNQIVARDLLEQAGAIVEVVENGQRAITALSHNRDKYDVILMDVQMPIMDGFTATRYIRKELQLQTPIIAMTAGVTQTERDECVACGMNDLIAKPFDADFMLSTVCAYLDDEKKKSFAVAAPTNSIDVDAQSDAFDISKLLAASRAAEDGKKRVVTIVDNLLESTVQSFSAAKGFYKTDERKDLARLLHTLRGSIGMLGAKGFIESASKLEALLLNDGHKTEIDRLFTQVEYELIQTIDAARAWAVKNRRSSPK